MKCFSFLMLWGLLQVSAASLAQRVSLRERNAPLTEVFDHISGQTGFDFAFSSEVLALSKPVTLVAKDEELRVVLDRLFAGQPLEYELGDRSVVVKVKEVSLLDKVKGVFAVVTVRGKVVDEQGVPVPGVNVVEKGTVNGTTTDGNGAFSLTVKDDNSVVVLSFTGYETLEVVAKNVGVKAIVLNTGTTSLQEVVINKGYYTEKRKLSVSNVGHLTSKDIEKQPVSNPLLALQGRIPGVIVTQSTGLPGTGVSVRIQGDNSISSDVGKDPLYVIDGVPYISQLLPNLAGLLGGSGGPVINGVAPGNGNPMNYINPNDIQSIEVLKDADATSIYGSRAANGAILITTKRAKAGETKVDFNIQTGTGRVATMLKVLDASQYLEMRRAAKLNDKATVASTDYDLNGLWDTNKNTDWQKTLIGGTAIYTDVEGTLSGGSANTQVLVGSNYHRETTVFPGTFGDQKASVHFNIQNSSTNKKFHAQLTGYYLLDNNQLPQTDLKSLAVKLAPVAPNLYNSDGTLNWMPNASGTSTWTNPLSYLEKKYQNKTNNLVSNAVLSYDISPSIEIKSNFGYNNLSGTEIAINPSIAEKPESRPTAPRSALYGSNSTSSWIVEPQINFNKSIGEGHFNAVIGSTIFQSFSNFQQFTGVGYNSDGVLKDIKSASSITVSNSGDATYKYEAIFSRLNYVLKDKYIFNITGRRDGSSRFGDKNHFHNFWSVGSGWIFSDETFIHEKLSFLNFGKLRGSYGTTGNDQIGDYRFLSLYNSITNGVPYQGVNGLGVTNLTNPYLQWEETKKLQIGFDLGLFSDRLSLTVNYIQNKSSNQLLSYDLPIITGFGGISTNFPATVQNRSWEFAASAIVFKKNNFSWSASANLTIPKNTLLAFPDLSSSSYSNILIIGQPISVGKTFQYNGVDPVTGQFQFLDQNGVKTFAPNFGPDQTAIINNSPKFYGGLQNTISYKDLSFSFSLQFKKQSGRYYLNNGIPGRFVSGLGNQTDYYFANVWRANGDDKLFQKFSQNTSLSTSSSNFGSSSGVYGDASYIRLGNVSLSYQLPKDWQSKLKLKNCRVFINGQNIFTITNYKGFDPDSNGGLSLPPLRTVVVGLNLTL